ncbi:conserved protein of unknown function [Rhodovastum atsumiense]|uniref:Helix-turn-helix domain-containing protein n=1 Tax=Rhodovastum atsumiense TaxID=504468 RepID=A0A5M6J173_9PROT|nr:hypothetical protein [Rhodovastum atsumiense]KAA5613817.1 hypothetical protein F1189_03305 [Rhodovastum atsumiense]CAH2601917.1 conserved protein of unknown function [Rhodovastum atsumiense]
MPPEGRSGLPLPPARYLTQEQAAAYVGVSVRTFAAEVANGRWPPPLRRGARGGALTWDRARARADWHLARELLAAKLPKPEIRERLLKGLQRRDLRRTAMVRMAEADATTAQIAVVSSHTIDQTSRILDTYIPRRGEVAAGAIDAWERGGEKVVSIPARAR